MRFFCLNSQSCNELPSGWTITNLGSIIRKISNGITHKQTKTNNGIPVTRIETISNGIIDLERVGYLPEISNDLIEKYKLESGDILFSNINSDFHLGKTAIFTLDTLLLHGMNLLLLRPNQEIIVSKFFNYLCNWFRLSGQFISIAQHAVNQSSINQTKLSGLQIPVPPLNEQKRIVSKLEELLTKLDAGIEYLKETQILLKQYRQSILKYAFEGKLTEKWRKENPHVIQHLSNLFDNIYQLKDVKKKEHLKILYNNLIQIPNEWKWTTIGDITLSMKNGIYKPPNFYNEKGIACLRMYNIEEGNIIWKDIKRMNLTKNEVKDYELNPGDILVNRVNSRELVGKAATIPHGLETCIYESKNIRLRISNKFINSKLVSFWFLLYGQRYFNNNAQQTVGMASINQVQLGAMPIPLMSIEEQELLIREIERRFSIISHNIENIKIYLNFSKNLYQSILKVAFEGKLVLQDPADEPVEILLERIKREIKLTIPIKKGKSKIAKKKSIDNDSKQMRLM